MNLQRNPPFFPEYPPSNPPTENRRRASPRWCCVTECIIPVAASARVQPGPSAHYLPYPSFMGVRGHPSGRLALEAPGRVSGSRSLLYCRLEHAKHTCIKKTRKLTRCLSSVSTRESQQSQHVYGGRLQGDGQAVVCKQSC